MIVASGCSYLDTVYLFCDRPRVRVPVRPDLWFFGKPKGWFLSFLLLLLKNNNNNNTGEMETNSRWTASLEKDYKRIITVTLLSGHVEHLCVVCLLVLSRFFFFNHLKKKMARHSERLKDIHSRTHPWTLNPSSLANDSRTLNTSYSAGMSIHWLLAV